MWTIFKVFYWICYNISSFLCFGFSGCQACGIFAPWPGIKHCSPCIGSRSLNHWTTREVLYSSVDGHLGSFLVLAIVNSAAMNIGMHVSFQIRVFVFSRYIPSGGIAGSHGNSIFSFLSFFGFYAVLHSGCIN